MGIGGALFESISRIMTTRQLHRRWFCKDKPDRLRLGYEPDGMYPQERSEADKERLPYAKTCCPEEHRAWRKP